MKIQIPHFLLLTQLSASSVQPETGSLDEAAGMREPALSYTKKGTP